MGDFDQDVERLLKLEMVGATLDTALGVIGGLYRSRGCDDGDLLLSWAPDFPLEHAASVADYLAKRGISLPADRLGDLASEWAHRLTNRKGALA